MVARGLLALYALSCGSAVNAQSTLYQFTMSVTSPAPVPGQPFTITWSGGESTEAVYIVLNDYFPDTTSQNIIYGTTDILSNAPNNGSWTYHVPLNIEAGRHSFSIGYNPFQLSDTSAIFNISSSQTSSVAPVPATSNTAFQSYLGCGLPPLPDYTYTGYQPPCIITTSGRVETIYPIVPASDSSLFFGSIPATVSTEPTTAATAPSTVNSVISLTTVNPSFATGAYAQVLQCPTPVTPTTSEFTASGTTTILSLVGCNTAGTSSTLEPNSAGVCHTSGYSTFSVSGTNSVCCPNGWTTTPLNSELFCFTSTAAPAAKRAVLDDIQAPTETTMAGVFTIAGHVTQEATVGVSGTSSTTLPASASESKTTTKSSAMKLDLSSWGSLRIPLGVVILSYVIM